MKSIKNVVSLTYLVGAYLIQLGELDMAQEFIVWLAKLGKGKTTTYYVQQGLQDLLVYYKISMFFKANNIPPQEQEKFIDMVRWKRRG